MHVSKTCLWILVASLALSLPLLADTSSVATAGVTPTATVHHHHEKHKTRHHRSKAKHSLARAKPDPATKIMMERSNCFICHAVDHKVIGPAYVDVAKRYRNTPGIVPILVKKVRDGGSGNWGTVPMVAHPELSTAQLTAMVKWVLAQ